MARLDGDRSTRKLSVLAPPPVAAPAVAPVAPMAAPVVADNDSFDPLEDAKENLRLVKAAFNEAVPREVAALSKRRQELVALIAELGGTKEVSIADQLAAARERRRAGAAAQASSP